MNLVDYWLYGCAALVSGTTVYKFFKFLGWKKGLMFFVSRNVAKTNGFGQGLAMWPALIMDIILFPFYALVSVTDGTVEKRAIKDIEKKWSEGTLEYLFREMESSRGDMAKLKQELHDLIDSWVADETVVDLYDKVKELEIELTRVGKEVVNNRQTSWAKPPLF